jgi:hypothetical protein
MLGLRRRKRIEGWAVDVSETDGEMERQGFFQWIGDNSRAWFICLVGIVLLTGVYVKYSRRTIGGNIPEGVPLQAPEYFRERPRYTQFEQDFRRDKRFVDYVVDARFLSPGRFQVVVSSGIGADDMDYLAKMAAERVRYVFHHRTVVQIYKEGLKGNSKVLVATAQWQEKKHGYWVKLQSDARPSR